MASSSTLSSEQELHLQTAFLLASVVDAFDPIHELKEKVELHNITEYAVYDNGPLRCLVALSSNAIRFGAKQVDHFQVNPTVFITFSNSLRHPLNDVPGQASMANFLAAQRPCGFAGAAACHVHGHALAVLESVPLGTVFSLLGQGYKLVATGFKFGGVVAHLFATRVLLQLHQEVQMARQMGINLSMTLADNKVSSYAFGSPFFATSALSRSLTALELLPQQQVNLHTIWRAGDGSPAFFAAASELFTVASEARDAAIDAVATDADGGGGFGGADDASSMLSIARTPQVAAVQEWCRYVSDGVDALSRCRAAGPSRLMARPLEMPLLVRVCAPGGLFALNTAAAAAGPDFNGGDGVATAVAVVSERVSQVRIADGPELTVARRTSSVTSTKSRRRSMEIPDAAAAAALAGRPLSPSRSVTARSKRPVTVTPSEASKSATGRPMVGGRPQAARQSAWRDGLLRLLQVMGDGLGERYAPVGQFWILGTVPNEKDHHHGKPKDAPRGALQLAEGPRAMQSSAAWLSPGNAVALFPRWESELEEIQRDLMEAFPWVTFRPTVEVRGAAMDRRDLLRKSAELELSA